MAPQDEQPTQILTAWQEHKFLVLIAGAVMAALFLVSVALGLYNSSGAAQVDLSRPDYEAIRAQATQDKSDESFDSTGDLGSEAFDAFNEMYDARAAKVVGVDSFDAAALSEDSLQLFGSNSAADGSGN